MYIPNYYQMENKEESINFIKKHSFGLIISIKDNIPIANHLPFVIDEDKDDLILISHFSKNNPQLEDLDKQNVLLVFSEPHAYISPKNYENILNVPTWNYISVQAYGKVNLMQEKEKALLIIDKMINNYEKDYIKQWDNFPETYKNKMINGIVCFEIKIEKLEAKKKLSQNKSLKEQKNIINTLSKSNKENEILLAKYMKNLI